MFAMPQCKAVIVSQSFQIWIMSLLFAWAQGFWQHLAPRVDYASCDGSKESHIGFMLWHLMNFADAKKLPVLKFDHHWK
jgi:hypothetical protein